MTYSFIDTPGGLILKCTVAVHSDESERAQDLGMESEPGWIRSSMNLTAAPIISWEESARLEGCTQIETATTTVVCHIPYDEFDART